VVNDVFEIVWTRAALVDLDEIFEYVSDHSGSQRAQKLYTELRSKATSLTELPHRGRLVLELKRIAVYEFREILVGRYRIVYLIDENKVVLVGILDDRRDLGAILVDRSLRVYPPL
jgi:toxin ParE1/3/4